MYYFIINPKSRTGLGKQIWHTVQKQLKEWNIPYSYYYTHYEFHAVKLAKEICNTHNGIKKIVVIGGDGTMNEVINGISSYEDVLLGYIPSGSSNDLARGLAIPSDPVKALKRIVNGKHFRYTDHGCLQLKGNHEMRKFAVSSGIGFDADICYEALDSPLKKFLNKLKLGKLTYGAIAIKQLIRFQPFDAEFIIDGTTTMKLSNVFFAASMIHSCEGGGLHLAPHAKANDRKLSVCIFYDIPKWKAIFLLPSLLFGLHQYLSKGVKLFDCSTLSIKTTSPVVLHTDGEFAGRDKHVTLSCTKEQVRMLL